MANSVPRRRPDDYGNNTEGGAGETWGGNYYYAGQPVEDGSWGQVDDAVIWDNPMTTSGVGATTYCLLSPSLPAYYQEGYPSASGIDRMGNLTSFAEEVPGQEVHDTLGAVNRLEHTCARCKQVKVSRSKSPMYYSVQAIQVNLIRGRQSPEPIHRLHVGCSLPSPTDE